MCQNGGIPPNHWFSIKTIILFADYWVPCGLAQSQLLVVDCRSFGIAKTATIHDYPLPCGPQGHRSVAGYESVVTRVASLEAVKLQQLQHWIGYREIYRKALF